LSMAYPPQSRENRFSGAACPQPARGASRKTFAVLRWYHPWRHCVGFEGRRELLPHEEPLLTDQQLRNASLEQLEDLVQRINLALQERGVPGLVWRQAPEDQPRASDPADPGAL
jgi:hypothetical protein